MNHNKTCHCEGCKESCERCDYECTCQEIREEDGTLVITGDAPAGMGNYPEWYYDN